VKVPLLPVADRVAARFFRQSFRKTADEYTDLSGAIGLAEFAEPKSKAEHLYAFYLAHLPHTTAILRLAHPDKKDSGWMWQIPGWGTTVTLPGGGAHKIKDLFDKAWSSNKKLALKAVHDALGSEASRLRGQIYTGDTATKIAEVLEQVGDEDGQVLQKNKAKASGDILDELQRVYTALHADLSSAQAIKDYQEVLRRYLKEGVPDPEKIQITETWDMLEKAPDQFESSVRKSPSITKLIMALDPKMTETDPVWFKVTVPLISEIIVREKLGDIRQMKAGIKEKVKGYLEALAHWLFDELSYESLKRVMDEHTSSGLLYTLSDKKLIPDSAKMTVEGRDVPIRGFIESLEMGEVTTFLAMLQKQLADIIYTFFDRNRLRILRELGSTMAKLNPTQLKGVDDALRLSPEERARRLVPYLMGVKLSNVQGTLTEYQKLSLLEQTKYAERIGEAQEEEKKWKSAIWGLFKREGPLGPILQFAQSITRSNELAALFVDRLGALWGAMPTLFGAWKDFRKAMARDPEPADMRTVIQEEFGKALNPAQIKKIDELSADELKRIQEAMARMAKV